MEETSKDKVEGFSEASAAAAAAAAVAGDGSGSGGGGGGGDGGGGVGREDYEVLKRRITCHPLYELLIETHLECLKASRGDIEGVPRNPPNKASSEINTSSIPTYSDLDHFMEMYCMALSKLKEAIEEPVQETTAFIDGMYFQLMELTGIVGTQTDPPPAPPPASPGKREE